MCRFVSPMQHALFLFPVIPTLHRTVNQHQYKYYYQRLAEVTEKMGSSTSFREIYVCLKWTTEVMSFSSFVWSKKSFRFWQVMLSSKNLVLYAFQCAEFGKYLRYLIRSVYIPLVCIPTSSHILFKLGFWTLRAEILHIWGYFARGHARFFVFFTFSLKLYIFDNHS